MDVGAAFIPGAQPLERVQPGEASFDHPALLAQTRAVRDAVAGDPRSDVASGQPPTVDAVVVAAANSSRGLRRGRPRLPRIGGTASTSGMSWVTSLRLPPVSVTASGTPPASTIRWCLEPGRPRSTGEAPTWAPPFNVRTCGASIAQRSRSSWGRCARSGARRRAGRRGPCGTVLPHMRAFGAADFACAQGSRRVGSLHG